MTRPLVHRRSQRRPVVMDVQCRTHSGLRDRGEIWDVSAEGCCLRLRGLYVRVGARLMLRPEGLEALTGLVRWVEGDLVGIEFERVMYAPVIDHLVGTYGPNEARGRA